MSPSPTCSLRPIPVSSFSEAVGSVESAIGTCVSDHCVCSCSQSYLVVATQSSKWRFNKMTFIRLDFFQWASNGVPCPGGHAGSLLGQGHCQARPNPSQQFQSDSHCQGNSRTPHFPRPHILNTLCVLGAGTASWRSFTC